MLLFERQQSSALSRRKTFRILDELDPMSRLSYSLLSRFTHPKPSRTPLRSSVGKIRLGSRDPKTKREFGSSWRTNFIWEYQNFPRIWARIPSKRLEKEKAHSRPAIVLPQGRMKGGPLRSINPAWAGGEMFSSLFRSAPIFVPKTPADPENDKVMAKNSIS